MKIIVCITLLLTAINCHADAWHPQSPGSYDSTTQRIELYGQQVRQQQLQQQLIDTQRAQTRQLEEINDHLQWQQNQQYQQQMQQNMHMFSR
jgi:TolA-binding protein